MLPLILPLLGFETIAAIVIIALITGKRLRRRYPNIVLNRAFAQGDMWSILFYFCNTYSFVRYAWFKWFSLENKTRATD